MSEIDIGHNNPPEPTPYEIATNEIEALVEEARHWLDGGTVQSQSEAEAIAKLVDLSRKARKKADDSRKVENEPFDTGKAEVQGRYNPLLAKADLITDACKKANTPWLKKLEDEQKAIAYAARLEAENKAKIARDAMLAAAPSDLAGREAAWDLAKSADIAEAEAKRAEKAKPQAKGGARAMSLRTTYRAELTDPVLAARNYWKTARQDMETFLLKMANEDVQGGMREIPGFTIIEEKVAV